MAAEGADDVPVAELLARGLAAHRAGALGDAARLLSLIHISEPTRPY